MQTLLVLFFRYDTKNVEQGILERKHRRKCDFLE